MLIRWTAIPGYKDETWFSTLRTLFKIKQKYYQNKEDNNDNTVNRILFDKISEYLQLMSKYINFDSLIKVLLEVDQDSTFKYTRKFLK